MEDKELDDIIKENVPKLHSFVRGKVSNRNDAEDIVQDTLYQFLRTIRILENPVGHVSAWLYTVAHNLIINHGKKRREESMPEWHAEDDDSFLTDLSEIIAADDNTTPDMQMLRKMVMEELEKALSELPKEQCDAIVMTEIKGMTVRDAAEQMGVAVNTFLSRKHYAVLYVRKRLRVLYEELIG